MYSLWHIPSSTLLVTSCLRDEVEHIVDGVLNDGLPIEDLMLQIAPDCGDLLGQQFLGTGITDALHTDDSPPEMPAEAV
jgi:hypothetical protein